MLAAQYFPAWYLGTYPDKRVIFVSYEADFAMSWGRKARDVLDRNAEAFSVKIRGDSSAAIRWDIQDRLGGMQTAGVGGPITGKGADCLVAGTMIETDYGPCAIENLELLASTRKILTYGRGKLEYQKAKAFRRVSSTRRVKITTSSGRVIEATPEHRVFSCGKWVEAGSLAAGDSVMLLLQHGIRSPGISSNEGYSARMQGYLLLGRVQPETSRDQEPQALSEVRRRNRKENVRVLQALSPKVKRPDSNLSKEAHHLPDMQSEVQGFVEREKAGVSDLLHQVLFGAWSFLPNGGQGQSEMEARMHPASTAAALSQGVSADAATDSRTRQLPMRCLQIDSQAARSPYRRVADEQCGWQPGCSLLSLSPPLARGEGFQAVADTVALVEQVCDEAVVYDIQVENNHNFFANGILVHNCLIIDDPVKNDEEARSQRYRDKTWEWFQSTAYTRLEPNAAVVLIMTRWHRDDLAGRLMEAERDELSEPWTVLRMPAIAEELDPLGRKPGEALWPERWPIDALRRKQTVTGAYYWGCLYQQNPGAEGGAEWPDAYFPPSIWFDDWPRDLTAKLISIDPSKGKDAKHGDYSAIVEIARASDGVIYVDADLKRRPTRDIVEDGLEHYRFFHPLGIALETNVFQELLKDDFDRISRERGVQVPIFPVVNMVKKEVRIRRLGALLATGTIRFKANSPGAKLLVQQLRDFPNGEHDDGPDALEQGLRTLERMGVRTVREDRFEVMRA